MAQKSIPAEPWVFTQQGGERKTITLTGWAAPFGRPRKGRIVDDSLKLRTYTRRYADNDEPTRHIFGLAYGDWQLKGRWMDYAGGKGFAKSKVSEVRAFIRDAQPVQISWGNTLNVTGLVTELHTEWESPQDVAWTIDILINRDSKLGQVSKVPTISTPGTLQARLNKAITEANFKLPNVPPTIKGSFLDALDGLVGLLNAPGAILLQLTDEIDNLKNSALADIRRFRAGIQQVKTALSRLRDFYENTPSEFALEINRTEDELQFNSTQAIFGESVAQALRDLVAASDAADKAEAGKIKVIYTARLGDTWESISVLIYGSASRVPDILTANGLASGDKPVPGTPYVMPK